MKTEEKTYGGVGCFRYETTGQAPRCFRIIRFYRNSRKPRTIRQSMTESEAQAHCSLESTHSERWFDGYDYMKGCRP